MTAAEIAPAEAPVRFMIAREDVRVVRNEIRSTIRAGSLVRADDQVVRDAPEAFFEPHTYRFFFEISEFGRDDGRFLRKITNSAELDQLPPPGDNAETHWQRFWEAQLRKERHDPWDVEVECLEGTDYIVRASISRAVPAAPQIVVNVPAPVINVTVDSEPVDATVTFERDPDGRLASARITDIEETNGQLPD